MLAQDAALKELASSNSRRLLARNESFECTDVQVVDSALLYKWVGRESAPKWRGPATVRDMDATGVTATAEGGTFKSRYLLQEKTCGGGRVPLVDGRTEFLASPLIQTGGQLRRRQLRFLSLHGPVVDGRSQTVASLCSCPPFFCCMKPNILGDFAQAKYDAKRKGNPAARFM